MLYGKKAKKKVAIIDVVKPERYLTNKNKITQDPREIKTVTSLADASFTPVTDQTK